MVVGHCTVLCNVPLKVTSAQKSDQIPVRVADVFVSRSDSNLFVDESCIDCDTCRWMQGTTFASEGGKSAVIHQPETGVQYRSSDGVRSPCCLTAGSFRFMRRLYPFPALFYSAANIHPCCGFRAATFSSRCQKTMRSWQLHSAM